MSLPPLDQTPLEEPKVSEEYHVHEYVGVSDVSETDPEVLCAVCRDRFDAKEIHRLEDFCRRCWEIIAPLLIEESDEPLVPLYEH